jgi:hypothetical protein
MGKYEPLGVYLRDRHQSEVPMSFEQIEGVIGARLPPKAQEHRAWWSNNPSNNVMTKVWLEAGYQTERVDVPGRKLVFRRTGAVPPSPAPTGGSGSHPLLGGLAGLMRVQPGVDLTQPVETDWDANRR